ncbi:MAG: amino acid adenylation domain-containing protein, partial [Ardenticatenaceae bacterium]|nr:amino acid adenylation domain-containing protein [Ardenticatenaceae bacterium]
YIWQTLLAVPEISIHDNFFELGGHSLLATQLISQVQRRFKVKLPLREIFEQGSIAELAKLIETTRARTETAVIPLADTSTLIPVSFAQQRLLVLDQLDPNQSTYNIPLAFQVDGKLNETALQTAVDTLYQRHGSLRTTFFYGNDGQAYQQIAEAEHLPISTVDFANSPEDKREQEAMAWLQAEAQRPFNLNTGPLIRVSHLRLDDAHHLLLIVMHHIITDGWSMNIFVREFMQLYAALVQDRPAILPAMPIQYADFAAWQHKWLQGEVLEQQLAYWQNHLADAPTVLNLPTDLPRPKLQSTSGNNFIKLLSPELTAALSDLSHAQNSTLFMTLFAAYNLLLYRYSNQDDIVVGTPIANRNQPGIEGLIGFFVNMLPLRTKIGEQVDFTTLLAQVRQTVLEAHNHQDIPFEQVVSVLQPARDTSYSPVFQVSFTLQNSENTDFPPLAGLRLKRLSTESHTAKYDLTLAIAETNEGLLCTWEYGTGLFLRDTIERMHTHFETLLHSIIAMPEQPVQQLPLLPEAEKQMMLHAWQGAIDDSIPQICLLEQFEQWVVVQPEVTAVSDQHQTLTYHQLNQRANQLARLFVQQGVQPGSAVGIHMAASVPAIVTIMACHKARAAYVPFDPAYPTQRLQFMLDDTAAPVVITDSSLDHLETGACAVWHWAALQRRMDEQPDGNLGLDYNPNHPAYIIYTSGSTGQPKGVVCGHTGVFNMQRSFDQWGEMPAQAVYSLWTSLNFDASVYEIFPAFITGGSLAIVPLDIRADAPRLFTWLAEQKIQHSYLPPFMVEPLYKWVQQHEHNLGLLRLMVGVEPLAEMLLAEIQRRVPGLTLINAYGPTEATVCSTHYRVPIDSTRLGNAPIGKALLNFQVYLLDGEMQPVPIGVAGELYVGGIGLAQGYLNRPELTAERFVSDPFSDDPETRLYRTGDLARYLPDGNIMFIGRTDFQLKVRGFRIELGEIETHLLAQPGVAAAVVMPHTAADGLISLVAYYTIAPDADPVPDPQTLRDALHNALPNYMVPSIWMPLDKMPRTPNDKIDRKALPAPDLDEMARSTAYAPPTSPLEKQLVALWQDLLQVEQVGIHDNFFEMGGHSLLAMQMISALRQQLDKEIPLRLLFDAPTIAELAHDLHRLDDLEVMERIPLRPFTDQLPLSFAQQRLWFLEQLNAQANPSYNVPIHLAVAGPLDIEALSYSFNQLLERHESLRTRYFLGEDEIPYQEIEPYTAVSLPFTDLSQLPDAEKQSQAEQYRLENATALFDLQSGPLYRIHVVRLAPDSHQLLFTIHHIAFDAWSTNLFLREIVAHYIHKTTGQPVSLPELAVQYADFALWQQARLTPEVMAEQLAFWRDHLAHAPASLALPVDKTRPQWQTFNGEIYEFALPTALAKQVKQWTQTNQATLFMALLTAFYGLLYRYSNQDDIVVGTPIANREHPDLKNVIGFFLNTLALRANLDENMTWRDLLQQTRQTMVDAHDYQEYPFENLVQALLPDRDPSRHPLFQVMFVLQNQGDAGQLPTNLPIQLTPISEGTHTAKFDLLLDMQETAVGFTAHFEYNTDLFYPETIARMAEHFQQMVTAMVSNPNQPITQAQMLTAEEQAQIDAWNDTAVPIDPNELVHHRFEQQADATPDAVAVLFGDQQLTYAELDARANQLAHFLQANGVQPNDQVGIMIPRSVEMVTAVLAILKAGAGYVPLDPDYPPDRIELMMDHADVRLLLTHSSLDQSEVGRSRFNVDALDLSDFSEERVTAVIDPESTVYVIFTSGSTGTPKGVVLPHRALNNMLAWQKKAMRHQGPTRTLQFTSLSFDVHFQEMFSTWQAGGTLVLIPDDVRRDGEQLLAYLQKYRVERLFLPFVALHNLAEAAQWLNSYPDTLQEVITAGEALQSTPPIRDFFKRLPGCAFHNHYGPSESHVITAYTLGPDPDEWPALPPIGTVIDNNKIHLLDSNMRPVPIGVPGELYIEGLNLATGYINQPELTAERFISLTVKSRSPITVYRTGDLARYLPDGNIQYLGRNDFQVKIRGHRVELGEIETVLNQHPAVQQAVVQAHKPDQGAQQLVAYVIAADETAVTTLPAILREKLPVYMVPAHFIRLEQFPLTPSGKINRRALPAPENMEMVRVTPFVAPETPLQKQLVEIWERVLNVSPVGIHDNFFELGGHSLLAIRLVAAMQKATAVKLPLPRLFQEGTIAAIARYMSDPDAQTAHSPVVPLRPGSADQPPLVVIHPGSGQVLPYLGLVQALPKEQPIYGLQSMGLLPHTPAQTDIASMAASYLQALEAANIPQPYHLLGWSMGGVVAMEMAQQLAASGQAVGSLTLIDTFAPSGEYDQPSATTLLQWFARDTGYLSPKKRPSLLPDNASVADQLQHLWPQLQAAGNLPDELTWDEFEQQFAVFQANYAAMQTYVPRPFTQPVQLIVSKNSAKGQKDKWLGWQDCLENVSVDVLRGNHFTLLQDAKTIKQIAQTVVGQLTQPVGTRQ